jgi:hypothetical protein
VQVVPAQPVRRRPPVRIVGDVALGPAVHLGRGLPAALAAASTLDLLDEADRRELAQVVARRTGVRLERPGQVGRGRRATRPQRCDQS